MILPAISIMQPWPYAILRLGKNCENRSWPLPAQYEGVPVLMHAGKRIDKHGVDFLARLGHPTSTNILRGGILGFIVFSKRIAAAPRTINWADFGQYNWGILASGELPFHPCKGSLGFFKVDYPHGAAWKGVLQNLGIKMKIYRNANETKG